MSDITAPKSVVDNGSSSSGDAPDDHIFRAARAGAKTTHVSIDMPRRLSNALDIEATKLKLEAPSASKSAILRELARLYLEDEDLQERVNDRITQAG